MTVTKIKGTFFSRRLLLIFQLAVALLALLASPGFAQENFIVLATTTSTQDSGLLKHILPKFKAGTGIDVRVVALGTGQALATARRGDADVVMVHDPVAEQRFVDDGFGIERRHLMHNDFVLIGPARDPALVAELRNNVAQAFQKIAAAHASFVSRGDRSGTHVAEQGLWEAAGIDPTAARGRWYREAGSGMGATLNMASALSAYTLADRGTWLSFKNRGELRILSEGDAKLRNPYSVILVNPAKHPHVKQEHGRKFMQWLLSAEGKNEIAQFKINGEALFFPGPP
jgi:tungstate transport system substrate-binding protein